MDWYVIQAYSGYELKVKAAIEERIELANLKEFFWRNSCSNRTGRRA
jgi:transcriptional antiterminator NusG